MAKNIKLSATRINSFLSCKKKYWFLYYKKLPKLSNPSFKLGLAVHESLEFAGNIWMEKNKFSVEDTKQILDKYDEVSIREGIENYESHVEGKDLVKKRLADFVSGDKLIGLETKFGFWGEDAGPKILSKYGVPLMGAIDKAEQYDDDTLLIIDYKTSKTAPTPNDLKFDIQLSIYDIVARQIWPQYKRVVLALDLLKSEVLYTYRTDAQREAFEEYLKNIYDQMLEFDESKATANLHFLCPWCDFKDYCDVYQKACSKSDYNFLSVMQYSDSEVIEEWENVKAIKKILESRERELGMVIMEKIKRTSNNLKGNDKEVYVRQNAKTNYDLDAIVKNVPTEDFVSLVSLNKKAVDSYIDLNPSIKEKVMESVTTNYTSPFLASRKIKNLKKSS